MIDPEIANLRQDYNKSGLRRADVLANPLEQFNLWLSDALEVGQIEPNAMTLATVNDSGRPSARMVLLKTVDESGFVFFTNYSSRKGAELAQNPLASLVFWWDKLERQVRIEGRIEKVSDADSSEYFQSRPRGSQLGAVASPQSEVVDTREILEARLSAAEQQYADQDIPRPEHWGGYRLVPDNLEFWVGRRNRLHDRVVYLRQGDGWALQRLGA